MKKTITSTFDIGHSSFVVGCFRDGSGNIVCKMCRFDPKDDYGKYLISVLALDLGIHKRRLYEIVQYYRAYPIVQSPTAQLSWTHYVALSEIDDNKKRLFYESQAVRYSWSVRELKKQIKANLYENTPKQKIEEVFKTKLPAVDTQKVFKNTYDFSPFIELQPDRSEKALENRILANFEMFLRELGEDFSILGRQTPLKIDGETHYIDTNNTKK